MSTEAALPTFIAEAEELLRDMETGLLECTRGAPSAETINRIFRAAHTIKGSSGLFGLDAIVWFVHGVETALDRVRLGKVPLDAALIDLLLSCKDHIGMLVASAATADYEESARLQAYSNELVSSLKSIAGDFTGAQSPQASNNVTSVAAAPATAWHLSLRLRPEVLTMGLDPLPFIRFLKTFAELTRTEVVDDTLPAESEFDPQRCYVGFEIDLRTDADRARIEGAFEFVREDCTLTISKLAPAAVAPETSLASGSVRPTDNPSAPAREGRENQAAGSRTIRVDADKLDVLIDRIGELITAAARNNLAARRARNSELEESTAAVADLIEEVRESALKLRMVKIGATFARFQRVVHDVSREIGKEIQLVIHGEDTELDKTVVERIADPLTHLVRNAMDHGIEPVETRLARGKPAGGTLTLNAYHDSGNVVIEVSDDGGGLDRDKIHAKALARGLIEPGRVLGDAELFALIFEPGFSTAERITNLSGRGVGMDVVKRNIAALRGHVEVASQSAQGTTVTIRLPLTLAIINGFQIAIGESIFVLPLDAIDECLEFDDAADHDFTDLRGAVLPFVRLRELLNIKGPTGKRRSIVVVRNGTQRAGIVVDSLLGECQTVIKPLSKLLGRAECISGSSILGTGDVALILDVPALLNVAATREHSDVRDTVCA